MKADSPIFDLKISISPEYFLKHKEEISGKIFSVHGLKFFFIDTDEGFCFYFPERFRDTILQQLENLEVQYTLEKSEFPC